MSDQTTEAPVLSVQKLVKGENLHIEKEATVIQVGLGWDPAADGQPTFDPDVSAFCIEADGKIHSEKEVVYYSNPSAFDGAIKSSGDDLTGGNSDKGDDEVITLDLAKIPAIVTKVSIVVTIYDNVPKKQNFGLIRNAYARILPTGPQTEVKIDLSEDFSGKTAVHVCDIYRKDGGWKVKSIAEGHIAPDVNYFMKLWSK